VAPGETFVTDDISMVLLSAGGLVGVGPGGSGRVPLIATVAPSPVRSAASISFSTSRPGPLRVVLYDLRGRHVRTVLDESAAAAGLHVAALDGRDDHGRTLPSGLYFFQIRALEGTSSGRVVIAR
jgi:flagellar hook assembly protein FlgD